MSRKMNVYRMSDETAAKFVELYRQNDCLWDTTSESYKCKKARTAAYKQISSEMGITGFGPREVAQKIKNLRSAYHQEVRKVETSKRKCERSAMSNLYKPKVIWFDVLDTFLRPVVRAKPCAANLKPRSQPEQLAAEGEYDADSIRNLYITEEVPNGNYNRDSEITPNVQSKQTGEENLRSSPSSPDDPKNPTKKTKFSVNGWTVKNSANLGKFADEMEDYHPLARYVAESLRKMPLEYGISAESEIHDVIIKYKVYAMKKEAVPTHQKPFPSGQPSFSERTDEGPFTSPISGPKSTIATCQVAATETPSSSVGRTENAPDLGRQNSRAPSENNDDHS